MGHSWVVKATSAVSIEWNKAGVSSLLGGAGGPEGHKEPWDRQDLSRGARQLFAVRVSVW